MQKIESLDANKEKNTCTISSAVVNMTHIDIPFNQSLDERNYYDKGTRCTVFVAS